MYELYEYVMRMKMGFNGEQILWRILFPKKRIMNGRLGWNCSCNQYLQVQQAMQKNAKFTKKNLNGEGRGESELDEVRVLG